MRSFLIICLLLTICHWVPGQENRQIRARKIKQTNTRTEQILKSESEISFFTTRFDRQGREIEVLEFNADSTCIKRETFTYNRKGREILKTITDSLEHKHTVITSAYDKWNRLAERMTTENNLTLERIQYAYNTFDDRTEEKVFDANGNIKKITRYEYDSRSMLTRKTTTNSKGEVIFDKQYRYTY